MESNMLLQMKDDVMLHKALDILSNPNDIKNAETKLENNILILIMTKQFGYLFKLNFQLAEGSKELFFQKITQPILQTVQELKDNQAELCGLLVKKDKEILKLRAVGQTHSHEETVVFRAEEFLCTYNKYNNYFGAQKIPTEVLEKTVILPETFENIKQESNNDIAINIKAEADSQASEAIVELNLERTSAVKEEPEIKFKNEILMSSPKPKKRVKKLNL
ncbi:hypothetical protein evm_003401 [Chilo suppressalis]|nr:hypothetical protein evm_003401 [Chilo suppressalis]